MTDLDSSLYGFSVPDGSHLLVSCRGHFVRAEQAKHAVASDVGVDTHSFLHRMDPK